MANTHVGNVLQWDTVSGAESPFRVTLVKKIHVFTGLASAGGTTTLEANGEEFFKEVVLPAETQQFDFTPPQPFKALAMTAVGTGTVVRIHYA